MIQMKIEWLLHFTHSPTTCVLATNGLCNQQLQPMDIINNIFAIKDNIYSQDNDHISRSSIVLYLSAAKHQNME